MKKRLLFFVFIALLSACAKDQAEATADGQSGSITRFAVYQHYLYVLNQNEVQTYDISDRDKPVLINRLATDYGLETITIYDNTVFLGSTTALYILDLGNPAAPAILAKSERLNTIGFSGCDPVVVKGDYAFSTIKIIENICGTFNAESALVVYNIADKTNPVVKGVYPLSIPNGLGYKDQYLFICDEGSDELVVMDISNPESVQPTPYSIPLTDPYDLIVNGDRLIVSTKTDFYIFDIDDITRITQTGRVAK